MNTYQKLLHLSEKLSLLVEETDSILEITHNQELYNEIENNIHTQMENALTNLDMLIEDLDNGMYEDDPSIEEDSEWG